METTPPESGFDELLRLSQNINKAERQQTRRDERTDEKKQVIQGLRDIKITVALGQLELMAEPEMVAAVSALRQKRGNEDLRRLILGIVDDLEKRVDDAGSEKDIAATERPVKTLAVLLELLFSLE
ncbi:MAG: hypothetical protein ABID87_01170 [Chloroflexota bacterium]